MGRRSTTEFLEGLIPWGHRIWLSVEPMRTSFLNAASEFLTDSLYTLGFSILEMLV